MPIETIKVGEQKKWTDTDFSWQFGIGADHAHQLLRKDVAVVLKIAHQELGIRSVRFHGMFDDDMYTYGTLRDLMPLLDRKAQVREINFRQCGFVIDNILDAGMNPFIELSFMPRALASKQKTGLHYGNNITMPKRMGEWADYISRFIQFLIARYGKHRVERWYFEVWNEPDLHNFFAAKQADYFRLYQVTAETIKAIDPQLRVGGPSTSAGKWLLAFIDFCVHNHIPYDFISTHHYSGDAFGNRINYSNYLGIFRKIRHGIKSHQSLSEVIKAMFYNPATAASVPKGALAAIDADIRQQFKETPVIISEWNSMAIYGTSLHDEKYSAAFLVKSVLDLKHDFTGYVFWCLSDIYEEITQQNMPFHGGFGIFTIDGIRKPSFWGMKLLSTLYPKRLILANDPSAAVDYGVFTDGENYQILITAQNNDPLVREHHEIDLQFPGRLRAVTRQTIDDGHCNPKQLWVNMESPKYLTPDQVDQIQKESWMRTDACETTFNDGKTSIRFNFSTNDVRLYTLYRE